MSRRAGERRRGEWEERSGRDGVCYSSTVLQVREEAQHENRERERERESGKTKKDELVVVRVVIIVVVVIESS